MCVIGAIERYVIVSVLCGMVWCGIMWYGTENTMDDKASPGLAS